MAQPHSRGFWRFRGAANPGCRPAFSRPPCFGTNFSGFAAPCARHEAVEKTCELSERLVRGRRRPERPPAGTIACPTWLPGARHEWPISGVHRRRARQECLRLAKRLIKAFLLQRVSARQPKRPRPARLREK